MLRPRLLTFLSYSHVNHGYRKKLHEHFEQLKNYELIDVWDDTQIPAGEEFDRLIRKKLEETKVFILLVSREFIASDYCSRIEVKRALEKHDEGTALVIPIIVTPCDWKSSPLAKLVVAPKDGKPISSWSPRRRGWEDATSRVRDSIFQRFYGEDPRPPPRPKAPITLAVSLAVLLVAGVIVLWPSGPRVVPDSGAPTITRPKDAGPPDSGPPPPRPVELTVRSDPPGKIIVVTPDGRELNGRSPLTANLPPGRVKVSVSGSKVVLDEGNQPCPGGEVPFSKSEWLTVKADSHRQEHTVKLKQGEVYFDAVMHGHVSIGSVSCALPLTLTLYEGEYTASFDASGSKEHFVVKPGGQTIRVLDKTQPPP